MSAAAAAVPAVKGTPPGLVGRPGKRTAAGGSSPAANNKNDNKKKMEVAPAPPAAVDYPPTALIPIASMGHAKGTVDKVATRRSDVCR